MTKYTAADFENAKFAEHEDGGLATRAGEGYYTWEVGGVPLANDKIMAHKGWVPVPTKPVLTESEVKKMVGNYEVDDFAAGFAGGFRYAGGEVIPDPEPTNKERLAQLIGGGHESNKHYADGLAEYLDDMGVTAPNVKGN